MYLALVSFIITVALYFATIDTFFKITAISEGQAQPYAKLPEDLVVMLKEFFVVQFFFWLTLWAVKWSLLFMFKRLTKGLPLYTQIWWGVLIYSVLVFIGCCISNFTSCSSMKAWFTAGECSTSARDARAKEISLWFSLAADLSTDLLSMSLFLPAHRDADVPFSHGRAASRPMESQDFSHRKDQYWTHLCRRPHHHGHCYYSKCVTQL